RPGALRCSELAHMQSGDMQSGELPAAWSQGSCLGPRRGSAGSAILILPSWSHRHKASPELTGAGGDKGRVADHLNRPLGEAELCAISELAEHACDGRPAWHDCRMPPCCTSDAHCLGFDPGKAGYRSVPGTP